MYAALFPGLLPGSATSRKQLSVEGPGLQYHSGRLECSTVTHVEGEEDNDSIFAETQAPLV
ncbi:hypothetical protein DSO57_1004744 [Entomophthora muscae]|uniref:Uncharacterized protein n=1 Tax=Entomophthora muscae TaxID=34485 RepID=A0ACC2TIR9_9FUNG|nr:hypothetical protein DSO57_1004744 [Entomophthora muscae]